MRSSNGRMTDVATQSNQPNWTLGRWANYYDKEPAQRDKIYNVISLEISGTDLANKVLPPRMVREVDWVEKFWPSTKRGRGLSYPKVQLYCLMGVAEAWTVIVHTGWEVSRGLTHHLDLGLAHRLCGLLCVLSHSARLEGVIHRSSYARFTEAELRRGLLLYSPYHREPSCLRAMVRHRHAKSFVVG